MVVAGSEVLLAEPFRDTARAPAALAKRKACSSDCSGVTSDGPSTPYPLPLQQSNRSGWKIINRWINFSTIEIDSAELALVLGPLIPTVSSIVSQVKTRPNMSHV